ncbi:protein NCBP2AS2 [Salvelinus fontinalis]|uniref:protein NCBP2AS2 n=1 Tax=Salvelinus fontinalis TaxID=8038 RepID=UPI002486B5D2|nr:protein NCBP2AS2 [Salvelinus fontinalis]
MAIIRMLFSFLNNPRVIEKLAESRPIRRAAQIAAFAIIKAQIAGRGATAKVLKSDTLRQVRQEANGRIPRDVGDIGTRFRRVRETFVKELKDGFRDAQGQIKK